jgi:hypothetical protein
MDTESMARKKLCCATGADGSYCAGQMCMAWRWKLDGGRRRIFCSNPYLLDDSLTVRPSMAIGWTFVPCDDDGVAQWVEPEASYTARRLGYCGLAGETGEVP